MINLLLAPMLNPKPYIVEVQVFGSSTVTGYFDPKADHLALTSSAFSFAV